MSNNIITIFIVEFLILAVLACVEKNWGMVLYGLGGAILNVGILMLKKI